MVVQLVPEAEVILYGSVARGDRSAESDYDILIVTQRPVSSEEEDDLRSALYRLALERDAVVSTMLYDRSEWESPLVCVSPYKKNIEKDGVFL